MKKLVLIAMVFGFLGSFKAHAQDPYIGEIRMFAGNFAPVGWAKCEGQLLPISQYSALFSLLGTTYGGDGMTTFGLPDLRGRVPVGVGNGPGVDPMAWGQKTGSNTNILTEANLPSHSHPIYATSIDGNQSTPGGNLLAGTKFLDPEYSDLTTSLVQMNAAMVGNAGANVEVNNMQPSIGVTFIIALNGIYPPQN